MIQEKEMYADVGLWQEVEGDPTAEKVPTFYYSSYFTEPGYVRPTVPPVPSPPPLSMCKSKLVQLDAAGSSASLSLTKLEILKVKLDSTLGTRRPIENLDASSWTKTGASYSIGTPTSLVSMSDEESLKESASEVEKFLQESTAIGSGSGSKSIEGALKIAGKPAMALLAGDTVLATDAAATRVVVNQHAGVKATSPMLTLHFEGGALALTPDHVLFVDGAHAPARLAAVGSVLSSGRKVTAITRGQQGIVNPITVAGTILAAGPKGEPVVAATAPEWSADVLLSATVPLLRVSSFSRSANWPSQSRRRLWSLVSSLARLRINVLHTYCSGPRMSGTTHACVTQPRHKQSP